MPDAHGELNSAEEIVHGPAPTLRDVRFYKLSAELIEAVPSDTGPEKAEDPDDGEAADISVTVGLRTRQEGSALGIRIEFTASQENWRVTLDVAAEFEAEEPFLTSEVGRTDFADKVGVMTLYPYIREAVGNLTQRTVGASFILPTIQQGQITFADHEAGYA